MVETHGFSLTFSNSKPSKPVLSESGRSKSGPQTVSRFANCTIFSKFGCDEFLNSDREKFSEFGSLSESETEMQEEADAIKVEGISRRYAHTTKFALASI